jgi:MFS family permease
VSWLSGYMPYDNCYDNWLAANIQTYHPPSFNQINMETDEIPLFDQQEPIKTFPYRKLLSTKEIIQLVSFWFGYQYFWFLVTIIILPSQVEQITGTETKGTGLGIISFVSGIAFLVVSPIAGSLNDRFDHRYGRRRPWILLGTLGMVLSLFFMNGTRSLFGYTIAYLCLNLAAICCSIPFNGLVADMTVTEQNGQVSTVMGALNLFGYLFAAITGVFCSDLPISILYSGMGVVFITCTVLTCKLSEPFSLGIGMNQNLQELEWMKLFQDIFKPLLIHREFRLVFFSRFLFQLGIATIQSFLQYWISDCVTTGMESTKAVSLVMIPNLVLAPICALLTPNTNRKRTVYISSLLMISASLLMCFATDLSLAFIVSSLFGIGYGPFMTVEFAMLMDVLPNHNDAARDMSLWHTALILPQIISTPIAGWLLDWFQGVGNQEGVHCLGYKVTNVFTIGYLVLGSLVTKIINGIQ